MDLLDLVQWPAMLVTIAASWFVASRHKDRRGVGFWLFIVSNVRWIVWGWHARAYALVVLQLRLAALNIRGARKHHRGERSDPSRLRHPRHAPPARHREGRIRQASAALGDIQLAAVVAPRPQHLARRTDAFNDHLRFRGTEWNIPFKGEPGSIYPTGVDSTGLPYGTTTCFPLPTVERIGNPNIPDT